MIFLVLQGTPLRLASHSGKLHQDFFTFLCISRKSRGGKEGLRLLLHKQGSSSLSPLSAFSSVFPVQHSLRNVDGEERTLLRIALLRSLIQESGRLCWRSGTSTWVKGSRSDTKPLLRASGLGLTPIWSSPPAPWSEHSTVEISSHPSPLLTSPCLHVKSKVLSLVFKASHEFVPTQPLSPTSPRTGVGRLPSTLCPHTSTLRVPTMAD